MKPIKLFSTEWLLKFGSFGVAFIAGIICADLEAWWTPFPVILGAIILHDILTDKLRLYARIDAIKETRKIVRDVREGR